MLGTMAGAVVGRKSVDLLSELQRKRLGHRSWSRWMVEH